MGALIGLLIAVLLSAVISGAIIWIIGKLNLGLEVDNFGWAMLAGLLIGLLTNLAMKLLPATGGVLHAVVNLVISAVVIFACGAMLKGLRVNGYVGALTAAVALAVINFLALLLTGGGTGPAA